MRAFIVALLAACAVASPVFSKCRVSWANSDNWPSHAAALDKANSAWNTAKTTERAKIVGRLNAERRNSKEGSIRKGHEIPKESNFAQFGGWKFCKISKTTWRPMPKFVSYPSDAACKKANLRCHDGKCYCCSKLDHFGKNDAALDHDSDLSGAVRNKMRNAMHRTMQEDICLVRAEQRAFEVTARKMCERTRDVRAAQCEKVWVAKQKEWCQQLAELEAANDWVKRLSNSCAKRTSEGAKRHGIRIASQKNLDKMLATIKKEKAFIIDMKHLLKRLVSAGNEEAGAEVMEALAIATSAMNPDSQALIEEARKSPQAAAINCLLGELWNKLNQEEKSLRRKHDYVVREHEYAVWIQKWTCAIHGSAKIHAKKQKEQENLAERIRISNEKLCYKRVEQYDAEVADYHEIREVYEQEMKYATNMENQIAQWTGKVGADYWCKNVKPSNNVLGYVSFWPGKVNQHKAANGSWKTDENGIAGAESSGSCNRNSLQRNVRYGCNGEVLMYCKKFFGATASVASVGKVVINKFCEQGNKRCHHKSSKPAYKCLGKAAPSGPKKVGSVAFFSGKVNQHKAVNGSWKTDSNGIAGAENSGACNRNSLQRNVRVNCMSEVVMYCKKFFPTAKKAAAGPKQSIKKFCEQGNKRCKHGGSRPTFDCFA